MFFLARCPKRSKVDSGLREILTLGQGKIRSDCRAAEQGLYATNDPRLGSLQLVVIGKFQPKDNESPAIVKRVFDESHVKLFRLAEMPQLIDEIRRTGKDIVERQP
jgi:hypothetical protein